MFRLVNLALMAALAAVSACNPSSFKGSSGRQAARVTREYSQDAYPVTTARFVQGKLGAPKVDTFNQVQVSPLDLLVVVDNSQSMRAEQQNLATKLGPLLSKVENADWQIKVVTTDQRSGCNGALIKKGEANAAQRFQQAVIQAGINGDGVERGIAQAVTGLQCQGQEWVRQGSAIAVLILTDEDNCHAGRGDDNTYGCENEPGRYADHLIQYLASVRKIGKDARVYGLLWHPSQTQDQCPVALNRGHEYAKVIDATQGKYGSICDADYTATLAAISGDVAQTLRYEFELNEQPDNGSLEVLVDGEPWSQYEVDGKVVRFTQAPPLGAKVAVNYRHGQVGDLLNEFKLPKAAVDGSFKVLVNGKLVEPEGIIYDPATGLVKLAERPDENAQIAIEYQELVDLNDQFNIGKGVNAATVQATVNNAPAKASYDAATGSVSIEPAPPADAKVVISYQPPS